MSYSSDVWQWTTGDGESNGGVVCWCCIDGVADVGRPNVHRRAIDDGVVVGVEGETPKRGIITVKCRWLWRNHVIDIEATSGVVA